MKDSLASLIVSRGRAIRVTLPRIARTLAEGLTTEDYEALALTADEHNLTIPELMRRALESEAHQ